MIIYKGANGTIYQKIISYVPDKEYLKKHNGDISNNMLNKLDTDFSGYLFHKQWNGKIMFVLRIQKGKVAKMYNFIKNNKPRQLKTQTMVCDDYEIDQWFIDCDYYGDDPTPHNCGEPYSEFDHIETICYDDGNIDCGDPTYFGNPLCQTPPPPDPPAPPAPDVKNDLTGCNKAVVDKLLAQGFTGAIADILHLFNSSDKINMHFIESSNTNGGPALAYMTSPPGSNVVNIEVRVNTSILPNGASQEYKAAVLSHEIIHAYLDYKGIDLSSQLKQHTDIANDYVDDIASMLEQAFGLDTRNADALSLGGLNDFATQYPTDFAQLLTDRNLTKHDQGLIVAANKDGGVPGYGTPCPQ
ncbi:hypothetical protein ACFGVR_02530 [Mucilaginibacter sp. AW1-3]